MRKETENAKPKTAPGDARRWQGDSEMEDRPDKGGHWEVIG